jgi:hypothetical protein
MKMSNELNEAIASKIGDVIKNNKQALPCTVFENVNLNNPDFKISVDAKIHLECCGVDCDFEIHYPEVPQA